MSSHLQSALQNSVPRHAQEVREGVLFRAAHWALEDHDASAALDWLGQLPQGAARRTLALRMKLRAAQHDRQTLPALETARLVAKWTRDPGRANGQWMTTKSMIGRTWVAIPQRPERYVRDARLAWQRL